MDMLKAKFIHALPAKGDWQFMLLVIPNHPDILVLVDRSGNHPPRVIEKERVVVF